jgi:apolipoprotein N-acyltransferase
MEGDIVESDNKTSWIGTAGRRVVLVAALIAVLTLFWVLLLLYTNLPTIALAAIAVVGLLLLAVATAWAASAVPRRSSHSRSTQTN